MGKNTENEFKCRPLSWDEVHGIARDVSRKIRSSGFRPDMIVALARGGLVPARIMSDFLEIKDLAAIKVEHWGITASPDKKARLKYPITVELDGKNVLIVDDITDTGDSLLLALEHIRSLHPLEVRTATLQHIRGAKCKPDFFGEELNDWVWIIYPWNFMEDLGNLILKTLAGGAEKSLGLIGEELRERFALEVKDEDILESLQNMEGRKKVEIINKEKDIFWKAASAEASYR